MDVTDLILSPLCVVEEKLPNSLMEYGIPFTLSTGCHLTDWSDMEALRDIFTIHT